MKLSVFSVEGNCLHDLNEWESFLLERLKPERLQDELLSASFLLALFFKENKCHLADLPKLSFLLLALYKAFSLTTRIASFVISQVQHEIDQDELRSS